MSRIIDISDLRRLASALTLVTAAFFASGAACGQVGRGGPPPSAGDSADAVKENGEDMAHNPGTYDPEVQDPRWKEVDRLVSEAKFEAAAKIADEILADARETGNPWEQTRSLIKLVQLRTGLHGYETAVRFLREEPWPKDSLHHAILSLFYARSLATYLQSYSWEIGQRERVETGEDVDLKAWTRDQIHEEVQRAYLEVWNGREGWGDGSLGTLAEYIDQNTYPARIRGTLRDAVTYLWVELLADTSQWRPEHSNEVYRLDLDALLADQPPVVALDDPEIHPLARLATILGDLEAWHLREVTPEGGKRNTEPEAAFEARLERIRRLRNSFSQTEDRKAIRQRLEASLDDLGRRYPWWSKGMAELAEMTRGSGDPNHLVAARKIALEGAEAHPNSAGGQHCRHIVAQIEAPSYEISAMAVDSPGQRSILAQHRNLEALHFRAYAIDVRRRVEQARDHNLLPGYRDVPDIMSSRQPAAAWRIELPATPDYESHRTYVVPPIEAPGLYLVVASARGDFAQTFNQQTALNMFIGDLVLVQRSLEGDSNAPYIRPPDGGQTERSGKSFAQLEITARSGASGVALAGVEVDLYRTDYRKGHTRAVSQTSGEDGRVRFETNALGRANYFLLARHGDDVALMQNLRPRGARRPAGERTSSLIYTDRSVYRPRQKILWKVVAYRGQREEGRFQLLPETELTVELIDANGQQVASAKASTNAYGSTSGEFDIPGGRLLGNWRLRSSLSGSTSIKVEEYKRPTFEAKIIDPAAPLRLNQPATLTGEVRYYFGLPVVTGDVAWRVTREPVYPRWRWYFRPPTQTEVQTVATGDANLDADGHFQVSFTPEADERLSKHVTYRYRLSADVTDEGGETRSASRTFRLGFVAIEATFDDVAEFFRAGEAAGAQDITVRRTDLDGIPRSGAGSWRLLSLAQPETALLPADQPLPENDDGKDYKTPGDGQRPRWEGSYSPQQVMALWPDGDEIGRGSVRHGDDGEATISLSALAPGAYRLRYTTTDDFGAEFETRQELMVAAASGDVSHVTELALPVVLMAERSSVPVGESARFFVHSGLEDQELLFEVFSAGHRTQRRMLTSGGDQLIEIPISSEHRGGFGVRLTGLRDHQLMTLNREVFVPWDDRELKLEFATFRDRLKPGDTETWRVVVRGNDEATLGRGAAEVLAYMYDRSLDVFAPHQPANPRNLYPRRTGAPGMRSNLGLASRAWQEAKDFVQLPGFPTFIGDRLKFYDGYGIGGPGRRRFRAMAMKTESVMMESAAMPSSPAPARMQAVAGLSDDAVESEGLVTKKDAYTGEVDPPDTGEPPAAELRTNFSETAFWEPHLVTGDDGSVAFELTVPDSVTEWNVWVHAITRDLRAGSLQKQTKTVKELLVRPYLPRFFREGDRAELEVVVNNSGDSELSGELDFEIVDPETDESLLADFGLAADDATNVSFTVAPGGGTSLTFPVKAPARVGTVAFRVIGRAGDLSDGELRPLPVLPGRLHLAQSRFATLHDADRRTLVFKDMKDDDPTRIDEQLVVTLDAQLFYSVLNALPYLASYPYECTEQLLNRFLSTGIVSSLYHEYPAVARMARQFAERETRLEPWDDSDPNRKMVLEETPWLETSRGGRTVSSEDGGGDLINVLDPAIAEAQRDASLAKLREAQTSIGGFPWWPGGPPSPYLTLYLLQGFSRALEFDVAVPQDMVVKAWSYMHRHYLDKLVRDMTREDCCWETVTYLNFVLSSYPDVSPEAGQPTSAWTGGVFSDDDRRQMLDFSFSHWKQHSPRLKGYLALILKRAGRDADAQLVFDSVMDSAKTTRDQGTFWAPEDRAWLWYNDTIETHAFALRTLTELGPDDARRHGLVQWLLINKKLNHWKSTRATAEVIYSLVHYLEREGALGVREAATVTVGPRTETYTFEPDRYAGKTQLVLKGDDIDPETMSSIEVEKDTKGFMFASATWHFSTEKLPEEARGDFFAVTRKYFKRVNTGREWVLQPLANGTHLEPGDQIEVQLSLRSKHAAEYVHLRDPRGAGFEPETTASSYKWDLGIGWYEEVRDSGTNFFFEWLPVGEYTFKYRLRASLAGTFRVGPAQVQSMYAPEFVAYSAGAEVEIGSGKP